MSDLLVKPIGRDDISYCFLLCVPLHSSLPPSPHAPHVCSRRSAQLPLIEQRNSTLDIASIQIAQRQQEGSPIEEAGEEKEGDATRDREYGNFANLRVLQRFQPQLLVDPSPH
jgi:hypothetical protein